MTSGFSDVEHMKQEVSSTVALLARTPAVLNALLRDLPSVWTLQNEGEDTWNVFDVVGHLIHAERTDWLPRVRLILKCGETRAFEPFDRFAQLDENQGKLLSELLDTFIRIRSQSLADLAELNLSSDDLQRTGRHPSFGVVTLSQLLATWAAHDLTHLHQISRIMAHQYREAVGPWNPNLGVLRCAGHSAP